MQPAAEMQPAPEMHPVAEMILAPEIPPAEEMTLVAEMLHAPMVNIIQGPIVTCNTETIEIVPPPEGKPPLILRRRIVTIPVEGRYEWISPSIAYYKSSSLSNAPDDSPFQKKIRKYMWFPTIGLIQDNSLIKNALRIGGYPTNNGFIVKYIHQVFELFNKTAHFPKSFDYVLSTNFKLLTKWAISPYLKWLGYKYKSNDPVALALIQDFIEFVYVMIQYCYNWTQIQDALRLSLENDVDGVKLIDSEFKDICLFILSHELKDEFTGYLAEIVPKPGPISKITVVFAEQMTTSSNNSSTINAHLNSVGAINYNLLIEQIPPGTPDKEIKTLMIPYYETMYLGKKFTTTAAALPAATLPAATLSAAALTAANDTDSDTETTTDTGGKLNKKKKKNKTKKNKAKKLNKKTKKHKISKKTKKHKISKKTKKNKKY